VLDDIHENNSYEILMRITEDKSPWRERKWPKTCCTANNKKEKMIGG